MGFKLGDLLLVANMLAYKTDEIYLYTVYATQIFSLYWLAVAFSAEMIRWMRLEQRIASSFLQYKPAQHVKKNVLKKEGFVLYQVFLILIFMVMAGESFGYVVNHQPTSRQYLDEKLLFLDPSTGVILAIVFPLTSSIFILLGSLMIRRLNADWGSVGQKRVSTLNKSILKATVALSVSQIFVGLRFFIERVAATPLKNACDQLLEGTK